MHRDSRSHQLTIELDESSSPKATSVTNTGTEQVSHLDAEHVTAMDTVPTKLVIIGDSVDPGTASGNFYNIHVHLET